MKHLFTMACAVLLVTASYGCKDDAKGSGEGGSSTFDSPEAVGKAFVAAINSGDAKQVEALFPSDALIKEAMTCESAEGGLAEKVSKERSGLVKELAGDLKGLKMEWTSSETKKGDAKKKGDKADGCTFNMDVEVTRAKWKFKMTQDGKSKDASEGVSLVKFGDKGWFLYNL